MKISKIPNKFQIPKTAIGFLCLLLMPLSFTTVFVVTNKESQIAKGVSKPKKGVIYPQNRYMGRRCPKFEIFPMIPGNFENRGNLPPKPGFGASKPL